MPVVRISLRARTLHYWILVDSSLMSLASTFYAFYLLTIVYCLLYYCTLYSSIYSTSHDGHVPYPADMPTLVNLSCHTVSSKCLLYPSSTDISHALVFVLSLRLSTVTLSSSAYHDMKNPCLDQEGRWCFTHRFHVMVSKDR